MVCCTGHWPCSAVWLPPVHCGLPLRNPSPVWFLTGALLPCTQESLFKDPNAGLPTARAQSWGFGHMCASSAVGGGSGGLCHRRAVPQGCLSRERPPAAGHLRGSFQMFETLQGSLPQSCTPSRSGGRVQNPPGLKAQLPSC